MSEVVEMADQALKKLEEQLQCGICSDTYTSPKQLQCKHVYCQKCLFERVQDQQDQCTLSCPICRQIAPIPAHGVKELQPAFHIVSLLEIQDSYKKNGDVPTTNLEKEVKLCSDHVEEELKLYCETCEKLVCQKCVGSESKHHNHNSRELAESFEKYKGAIVSALEPMDKQLSGADQELAHLSTRLTGIINKQAAIEASIHESIRQLNEVLDDRKTELIHQLHQITQDKIKDLAFQRDQIETTQAQLLSSLNFIRESMQTENQESIIEANMLQRVEDLATAFKRSISRPKAESDVTFSASTTDITAVCRNFGSINVSKVVALEPSRSQFTSDMTVGEKSTAVLQVSNFVGERGETIRSLQCELVSEITGSRKQFEVERKEQNQFQICYQPTVKGRHQLHVKVDGQHIKGSPFSVKATSPLAKLSSRPILSLERLGQPCGIVVNKQGHLIVTERNKHCVSVFSPGGKKLKFFGKYGSGQGELAFPSGVTVDNESNILVVDFNNHRIQKFTPDGKFLRAVGSKGSGPLRYNYPRGIAINAHNGKVYVTSHHHIQVLNSNLTFSSMFGREGEKEGEFSSPQGIACDSTGKVYVTDSGNHRIQVFTAEGEFLRMFGKCGKGEGELDGPCGVAVDASNRLYISERNNHRVSILTLEGKFVKWLGAEGDGFGKFRDPREVEVDGCGVVYVCDHKNNRVQLF